MRYLVSKSLLLSTVLTRGAAFTSFTSNTSLSRLFSNMNEEQAAQQSKPSTITIFDKIVSGEIPSTKVFEDDKCLAFRDVNPQAPTHILVIPKSKGDTLSQLSTAKESDASMLGHLMLVAGKIGKQECPKGFRIVINDGPEGCQSVYHLHLHIMGGRQMKWPPG